MNDYENEGSLIATIIGILLIVGIGIGGGLWYFFYKDGKDPFKVQPLKKSTTSQEETGTGERKKEDINDDGVVDGDDSQIVNAQIGCRSVDDCWTDVIGKTLSGDNPIYVSDLDIDSDAEVSQKDVDAVNSAMGQ